MADIEKRRLERTKLIYTLTLKRISGDGEPGPFQANIIDVSEGGIGFRADVRLKEGDMYQGVLKIWTKQTMDVILKIVRVSGDKKSYIYGSTFVGMSDVHSAAIRIHQMLKKVEEEENEAQ